MAESEITDTVIAIEVAYATPFEQKILSTQVTDGTTIYEAARQSGMTNYFPDISICSAKLGVFGKVVTNPQEQVVRAGDRIEIYRPLIADPKEVRKRRAEQAKQKKKRSAPS